jgi:hypothetical protein
MTDHSNAVDAVDDHEAAEILGVEPQQFAAMVEEGLLSPLPGPGERKFNANEVRALRAQGG